jgi:hypothetical protein
MAIVLGIVGSLLMLTLFQFAFSGRTDDDRRRHEHERRYEDQGH